MVYICPIGSREGMNNFFFKKSVFVKHPSVQLHFYDTSEAWLNSMIWAFKIIADFVISNPELGRFDWESATLEDINTFVGYLWRGGRRSCSPTNPWPRSPARGVSDFFFPCLLAHAQGLAGQGNPRIRGDLWHLRTLLPAW